MNVKGIAAAVGATAAARVTRRFDGDMGATDHDHTDGGTPHGKGVSNRQSPAQVAGLGQAKGTA